MYYELTTCDRITQMRVNARSEQPSLTDHLRPSSASQYARMLQEEGGLDILKDLITHPDTHDDVRGLAESIVGISEQNLAKQAL